MKQRFMSHRLAAPLVLLFGIVCVLTTSLATAQDLPTAPPVVDEREIIALVPSDEAAQNLLRGAEGESFVLRDQSLLQGLGLWMLKFTIPEPLDGVGAIEALERLERSATAGVNHAYRPASLGVSDTSLDYAHDLIEWPETACRASRPIGIIDTAVDKGRIAGSGARVVSRDFTDGRASSRRHGSDVASVLISSRYLAGATLYSAGVISRSEIAVEETGVDRLLVALDWLANEQVTLVNISLAGPYNKLLDRGVARATGKGMVIVAAVGNDGPEAAPRYPAAFDNVIAVTAVDAHGKIFRDAVRGDHVDLAAPGVDIRVEGAEGDRFVTGTSMAAPFVTARIAADTALRDAPLSEIIQAIATTTADLGAPGWDAVFGAGLIRAATDC